MSVRRFDIDKYYHIVYDSLYGFMVFKKRYNISIENDKRVMRYKPNFITSFETIENVIKPKFSKNIQTYLRKFLNDSHSITSITKRMFLNRNVVDNPSLNKMSIEDMSNIKKVLVSKIFIYEFNKMYKLDKRAY
jgi:hypothetical protein